MHIIVDFLHTHTRTHTRTHTHTHTLVHIHTSQDLRKMKTYLHSHSRQINIYQYISPFVLSEYSDKIKKMPPSRMRKEGNVLFNDTLNTFYLCIYGVGHKVKDHSDSEKENLLPPLRGLFFPVSSKGYLMCTIPQTG